MSAPASADGRHTHAHRRNADRETGAARVATLQDEYRREFSTRFRRLRGLVRETVATNDALQLRQRSNAEPAESFQFPRDSQRQSAFNRWFEGAINDEVLEPVPRRGVRNGRHYTAGYVRSGYSRGMRRANARLREQGVDVGGADLQAAFNAPVHRDTLSSLYLRNYSGLEGITSSAESTIARVLSEGYAAGASPRDLADELTSELRDVQHTRARTLARTEIMKAHARASANRYEQMGVERVTILTHTPCPQCAAYAADGPHPVQEAASNLPIHPNCVCGMSPVIS